MHSNCSVWCLAPDGPLRSRIRSDAPEAAPSSSAPPADRSVRRPPPAGPGGKSRIRVRSARAATGSRARSPSVRTVTIAVGSCRLASSLFAEIERLASAPQKAVIRHGRPETNMRLVAAAVSYRRSQMVVATSSHPREASRAWAWLKRDLLAMILATALPTVPPPSLAPVSEHLSLDEEEVKFAPIAPINLANTLQLPSSTSAPHPVLNQHMGAAQRLLTASAPRDPQTRSTRSDSTSTLPGLHARGLWLCPTGTTMTSSVVAVAPSPRCGSGPVGKGKHRAGHPMRDTRLCARGQRPATG